MDMKTVLLLIFFFSLSFPVWGEGESILLTEMAGEVFYRGEAFYHRFEPAQLGMTIYPGETIRVGPGGQAELLFPQGHTVLLGEDTEVRLYVDGQNALALNVLTTTEGELVYEYDHILDRIRIEVATPSAIAAIRGIPLSTPRAGEWSRTRFLLETHVHMTLQQRPDRETLSPLLQIGWELIPAPELLRIPWSPLQKGRGGQQDRETEISAPLYSRGRKVRILLSYRMVPHPGQLQPADILLFSYRYLF